MLSVHEFFRGSGRDGRLISNAYKTATGLILSKVSTFYSHGLAS